MYNEGLKNQFLFWRASAPSRCAAIFNRIAAFEQKLDKDILLMSLEEYHACLQSANCAFMTGFIELFRLVDQYGEWAKNALNRRPAWLGSCDMYEAYLQDAQFPDVWLWDDIYAELLSVYPITEGYAIWPIAVFGWLGLTMQECCDVKNEDVDLKRKVIQVGVRTIPIETDSQWKILSVYTNTSSGLRTQNRTFSVDLIDKGWFLKQTRTANSMKSDDPPSTSQIKIAFQNYAAKCIKNLKRAPMLSFSNIATMGNYHTLWRLDQQDHESFSNISTRQIQAIFHVKGVTPTRKMLLTEYQLYLKKMEERHHQ